MTTNVSVNLFKILPVDVYPIIFKNCFDLGMVALVCKEWQALLDSQAFRDLIRPLRAMGVKELKKMNPNIIDAGIEHLLPRRAYKDFAEKKGLLFFNPGKVKVMTDKGKIEEVVLDSLEAIGNLFNAQITNFQTVFNMGSWQPALKKKRKVEDPHWVWIDTKPLGFKKTYSQQVNEAKEEDKKAYSERYKEEAKGSGLEKGDPKRIIKIPVVNDLALGMLMADIVLKERHFFLNSDTKEYILLRADDSTKDNKVFVWQGLAIGFAATPGVLISHRYYSEAHDNLAFVCARKSFSL